jgi:hypothetical protein
MRKSSPAERPNRSEIAERVIGDFSAANNSNTSNPFSRAGARYFGALDSVRDLGPLDFVLAMTRSFTGEGEYSGSAPLARNLSCQFFSTPGRQKGDRLESQAHRGARRSVADVFISKLRFYLRSQPGQR